MKCPFLNFQGVASSLLSSILTLIPSIGCVMLVRFTSAENDPETHDLILLKSDTQYESVSDSISVILTEGMFWYSCQSPPCKTSTIAEHRVSTKFDRTSASYRCKSMSDCLASLPITLKLSISQLLEWNLLVNLMGFFLKSVGMRTMYLHGLAASIVTVTSLSLSRLK